MNQYQQEIEEYSSVIAVDPSNVQAYIHRGHAYFKLGQPQKALEDYSKAINLDPGFAAAYGLRSIVYMQLGEMALSKSDQQKMMELGFGGEQKPGLAEAGGPPSERQAVEHDPAASLSLPIGSRAEIMRRKRTAERRCRFQNQELEKRFKIASMFDYVVFGGAAFVFIFGALMLGIAWICLPYTKNFRGFSIVAGTLVLGAIGLIATGLVSRNRRQQLYLRAGDLVAHKEPCKRLLRLREAEAQRWLRHGIKPLRDLEVRREDGSEIQVWHVGSDLGNTNLDDDYPQLWQGMVAEVYLEPSTDKPLGMFVGDRVYWFI